jgi:hypothetical protein
MKARLEFLFGLSKTLLAIFLTVQFCHYLGIESFVFFLAMACIGVIIAHFAAEIILRAILLPSFRYLFGFDGSFCPHCDSLRCTVRWCVIYRRYWHGTFRHILETHDCKKSTCGHRWYKQKIKSVSHVDNEA